ncbi:MAG TPA: thioredoxin domain-containing protein, partial [Acidimicrobiales bacterium]|nr:thioredoxin domain-containing protein [Acidimicrobiales bacterium]
MVDVTDATFEHDVLDRSVEVPVVVDLWAEWCGPCRTLGPIIERVVAATDGRVELVKVDVDANPRISATFDVKSIPAVFALRDRRVVDSFIGALPEAQV